MLIIFLIKVYDVSEYEATIKNQDNIYSAELNIIPSEVINIVNSDYLRIDNKEYSFIIRSIGEYELDMLTLKNYQKIIIDFKMNDELKKNNLNVTLKFFHNKKRIIKKIKEYLF